MELRRSGFFERLIEVNLLDDQQFDTWIFYPGMLFRSSCRWWGNGGKRMRSHEGIDVCLYRDKQGGLQQIGNFAMVPVIYPGTVVQIVDDYLGSSIFVEHACDDGLGSRLHSVYGHTDVLESVRIGSVIGDGQIIAAVSDARRKNAAMASHLHLTLAWIGRAEEPARLSWRTLQSSATMLVDPLAFLECTYALLEQG